MTAPRARPLGDFLRIFIGPVVWFLHLAILYGGEALACMPPAGSGRAAIGIGTSATVGALGALVLAAVSAQRSGPSRDPGAAFLRNAALWLALLSAVGVIWNALPLALVAACSPAVG